MKTKPNNNWPHIHVTKRAGMPPVARALGSVLIDGREYGSRIKAIKWDVDMEGPSLVTISFIANLTIEEIEGEPFGRWEHEEDADPYENETIHS